MIEIFDLQNKYDNNSTRAAQDSYIFETVKIHINKMDLRR